VRLLAELVSAREAAIGMPPGATRFIGLVETAESLPALVAIAVADRRMIALGVGGEDLATDLEAVASPDALELAQRMGLLAARGGGILPLGALVSFADFEDLDVYREGLERSRALGFACTACIHPAQVALVNEAYGVDPDAVERARRLLAEFEQALARGEGAVAFEGQMVDLPVAERARRLIARAQSYARGKPNTSRAGA
jgi:citrate lyase subunit beta/citryl-CoA lyase